MVNIRDVKLDDAKDILEIYKHYILNTAITFEITVPSLEEFEQRIKTISSSDPYLVLTLDKKLIGYAYAQTYKGREAYKYSKEISIYLDNNYTKNGYGALLYNELEKRLKDNNVTNLYSCITVLDDSNSIPFHEHLGFNEVGRFHKCGYKFNNWYDIVWMEKIINKH